MDLLDALDPDWFDQMQFHPRVSFSTATLDEPIVRSAYTHADDADDFTQVELHALNESYLLSHMTLELIEGVMTATHVHWFRATDAGAIKVREVIDSETDVSSLDAALAAIVGDTDE